MAFHADTGTTRYAFDDLKTLVARASPARSGDRLAGVAAESDEERVAARFALADVPLAQHSALEATNAPGAAQYVRREYRKGWTL